MHHRSGPRCRSAGAFGCTLDAPLSGKRSRKPRRKRRSGMHSRNNSDLRSDAVLIFWYKTYATLLKENRKILFLTHQRLRWLKTTTAIALLCALALSWRLWISSRLFPLSPVGDFLPRIPYPFDYIWLFLLLVLLPAIIVIAQPSRVILTFLVLAGALALWDQAP